MKDSKIIKYIYDNVYVKGDCWGEWDIYDWFDLDCSIPSVKKLVTAIMDSFERFIFQKYKFTGTRPDYETLRYIWKMEKSYMHPLNKFRQRYNYYKPLKLKCLDYEQINSRG